MSISYGAKVSFQTPSKNPAAQAGSRGSSPGSTSAGSSLSPWSSTSVPRDAVPVSKAIGPNSSSTLGFGDLEPMPAYVEGTMLQNPTSQLVLPESSSLSGPGGRLLEPRYVVGDQSRTRAVATLQVSTGQRRSSSMSSTELELFVGQTFAAAVAEHATGGPTGGECAVVPGPHPGLATSVVQPSTILPSRTTTQASKKSSLHPEAGSRIAVGGPPWSPSLPTVAANPNPASPVLRLDLAEALPEPELGSPDRPTMGSTIHRFGNCKPCAFLHTKGCMNGLECPFCHLCDAGEKKRRQKEKKEQKRELSKWVESQAVAFNNLGVFVSAVPR